MLRQARYLFKGFGRVLIGLLGVVRPCLGFKGIDLVFSRKKINIATAEVVAQILVFGFGIKHDNLLS